VDAYFDVSKPQAVGESCFKPRRADPNLPHPNYHPREGNRLRQFYVRASDSEPKLMLGHAACKQLSIMGQAAESKLIPMINVRPSERYSTVVRCGGHEWLFTRKSVTFDMDPKGTWETLYRVRNDDGYGNSSVALQGSLRLSHNAAFICENGDTLAMFGGQAVSKQGVPKQAGIFRAKSLARRPLQWSAPKLVIPGNHGGCVEHRIMVSPGICEFDGRLSVNYFGGRHFLYARANTRRYGGGRHAQVAISQGGRHFGRFTLVKFECSEPILDTEEIKAKDKGKPIAEGPSFDGIRFKTWSIREIYLFVVRTHLPGEVVAVFPASYTLGKASSSGPEVKGGLFVATSSDGILFSEPQLIMTSATKRGRTNDWPVDWILHPDSDRVQLHIEHNIASLVKAPDETWPSTKGVDRLAASQSKPGWPHIYPYHCWYGLPIPKNMSAQLRAAAGACEHRPTGMVDRRV